MSKRLFFLSLAVAVLCSCMAVTVGATEIDTDQIQFVNVLEYATPNNSGDYYLSADSSGVATAVFELPFGTMIRYVDLYFWTSATSLESITLTVGNASTELTVERGDNYYYRAYGAISTGASQAFASEFTLTFATGTANAKVQFYSLRMSPQVVAGSSSASTFLLEDQSATQASGTSIVTLDETLTSSVAGPLLSWTSSVRNSDWQKYDFMTFTLSYYTSTINNVAVQINGVSVPYDINLVENPPSFDAYINDEGLGSSANIYSITVTVDLTGVPRTQTQDLIVTIQGMGTFVTASLHSSRGFNPADLPEAEVTWLQKIWYGLVDGFNSVVDAIKGDSGSADEFSTEVQDELDELDQNQEVLDSMTEPDIQGAIGDVDIDADAGEGISFIGSIFTALYSELFASFLMFAVIVSLIGYLLYGRR